jgi:ATPase subunit of ABC transporter with duplicated ATPase domains
MRCAARRAIADVDQAFRRRDAPRRALPLLLSKPDMLLLDEPTNHLDAESVAWLQNYLENFPGCVILVTHDRYFLDNHQMDRSNSIAARASAYEGNYSVLAREEGQAPGAGISGKEAARRRWRANWNGSAPVAKARQAKSKARLNVRRKWRLRPSARSRRSRRSKSRRVRVSAQNVIEADGLKKAFGDKLLIEDLSFKLPPGGIVGVIGPNGAGKTTLFKMITGQEKPDEGTIQGRRLCEARLRRPERAMRSMTRRPSGRKSPAASTS